MEIASTEHLFHLYTLERVGLPVAEDVQKVILYELDNLNAIFSPAFYYIKRP